MIDHIQINVKNLEASKKFYSELFNLLDWEKFIDEKDSASWTDGKTSIFLTQTKLKFQKNKFHRKNIGLNHLAFKVNSKEKVDEFYNQFLKSKENIILYGGPKEYPEYTKGYYAVYFEDPDRIKLEIVFYS